MSFNNVGKVWTQESFADYLRSLKKPEWVKKVCLHHCGEPNLKQRPKGFSIQHIQNMKSFYQTLGWNRGPHIFVDDDQIFGMTPLSEQGIHAPDFNKSAIGIEVLGNYDKEDPKTGRGSSCWYMATRTAKILLDWLSLPANNQTVVFHRECKVTQRTSQKSCPGTKISKDWVLGLINQTNYSIEESGGDKPASPVLNEKGFVSVAKTLANKGYSAADIKKNLRRVGKDVFWLDQHLEFAYYDAKLQTTMAPASELENIKNK